MENFYLIIGISFLILILHFLKINRKNYRKKDKKINLKENLEVKKKRYKENLEKKEKSLKQNLEVKK